MALAFRKEEGMKMREMTYVATVEHVANPRGKLKLSLIWLFEHASFPGGENLNLALDKASNQSVCHCVLAQVKTNPH